MAARAVTSDACKVQVGVAHHESAHGLFQAAHVVHRFIGARVPHAGVVNTPVAQQLMMSDAEGATHVGVVGMGDHVGCVTQDRTVAARGKVGHITLYTTNV